MKKSNQLKSNNLISIHKYLKLADFVTLLNGISGMTSVFFALYGHFRLAVLFVFLAMFFDFVDGKIARYFKTQNDFGKQMDSLCDAVSFGVAPAILGLMFGVNDVLGIISLIFYFACGILRLARFNITHLKGYEGVPITVAAMLVSLYLFASTYFISLISYAPLLYFVLGILMISSVHIRKI